MTKRELSTIKEQGQRDFWLVDVGIIPVGTQQHLIAIHKTHKEVKEIIDYFGRGEKCWYTLQDPLAVKLEEAWGLKQSNETVIRLEQRLSCLLSVLCLR